MERPVKKLVLGDPVLPARPGTPVPSERAAARVGWIVPPVMLSAVAAGVWFSRRGPDFLFGLVLCVIFGLGFLWILISSLLPGKADRRCPRCGQDALVRLSEHSTSGLACKACDYRDEHVSAWLLAEEEGPLERTVLHERAQRRAGRRAGRRPLPPASEEFSN